MRSIGHQLRVGSHLLAALVMGLVFVSCGGSEPPAPVPPPSPELQSPIASSTAISPEGAEAEGEPLPDAIRILGPEYHAAYRMLPDGEWARKYAAEVSDFAAFDIEAWQALAWGDGASDGTAVIAFDQRGANDIARGAGASEAERRWIVEHMREVDAESAAQFEAAKNVLGRFEALRAFAEDKGFAWEFREIAIRYGAMKAGQDEAFIQLLVEDVRDIWDQSEATWAEGVKEGIVINQELQVCLLLMDMVVGEQPRSVITEGRCDIARAASLAEGRLANGGAPARDEASFREWIEWSESPGAQSPPHAEAWDAEGP